MGRLDGKVALVTGAASNPGLGNSTAQRLAAEGAKLVVTDMDLEGAQACADAIVAQGGQALALEQNVCDEARWDAVMTAVTEQFGGLDVLVNNAGIAVLVPIEDTPPLEAP